MYLQKKTRLQYVMPGGIHDFNTSCLVEFTISARHAWWNSRLQYAMPGGIHDFSTSCLVEHDFSTPCLVEFTTSVRHAWWNSRLQYVMPGELHDFTTAGIKVKNAKLANKKHDCSRLSSLDCCGGGEGWPRLSPRSAAFFALRPFGLRVHFSSLDGTDFLLCLARGPFVNWSGGC